MFEKEWNVELWDEAGVAKDLAELAEEEMHNHPGGYWHGAGDSSCIRGKLLVMNTSSLPTTTDTEPSPPRPRIKI